MSDEPYDLERIRARWVASKDYDPNSITQPWEQPTLQATNNVAGGWACLIEEGDAAVILWETSSGGHFGEVLRAEFARKAWPEFERLYGEPEGSDA